MGMQEPYDIEKRMQLPDSYNLEEFNKRVELLIKLKDKCEKYSNRMLLHTVLIVISAIGIHVFEDSKIFGSLFCAIFLASFMILFLNFILVLLTEIKFKKTLKNRTYL